MNIDIVQICNFPHKISLVTVYNSYRFRMLDSYFKTVIHVYHHVPIYILVGQIVNENCDSSPQELGSINLISYEGLY